MSQYGLRKRISNTVSHFYTNDLFSNTFLIRLPFYHQSKALLSLLKGSTSGRVSLINLPGRSENTLCISQNDRFEDEDNDHSVVYHYVTMGVDCMFASKIFVTCFNRSIPISSCLLSTRLVKSWNKAVDGIHSMIFKVETIMDGYILGVNSGVPSYALTMECLS